MQAHGVGRAGADGLFSGGQLWGLRPGEARRVCVPGRGGCHWGPHTQACSRSHARAGAHFLFNGCLSLFPFSVPLFVTAD